MKKQNKGRQYKHKDCPSVTEIISLLDPGLHKWYGWLGTEECERITKQSIDFGHKLHDLIAEYLKTCKEGYDWINTNDPDVLKVYTEFHDYIYTLSLDPVLIDPEKGLYSKKYNFNGTPDFVNRENGKLIGYDWKTDKTSKKKDQIRQKLFKYGLQAGGYSVLVEENLKEKLRLFKFVRANKQSDFSVFTFSNLKPYQKHFLALREIFYEYKGK